MHVPRWLGLEGEKIAAAYLMESGYRIVARNYRFRRNEIDIIATRDGELCFVEVKTRASLDMGHPAEAVTLHKQRELARAASGYLSGLGTALPACRFDVIAILARGIEGERITDYRLEHFEGAFMTGGTAG